MWDALNHVTGAANVRLHHCERRGALQMIATCKIGKGEEVKTLKPPVGVCAAHHERWSADSFPDPS